MGERMDGPMGRRMERRGPGPDGFRMMIFSPTALLERRSALNLTPDQVTRLSTLETDVKSVRDKAETDSKPHREELEKLWQQGAPDVTQIRTHMQALMQAEQTARLTAATSTASAKAVLTPEQRGRVQGWADARMAERERGMRGMMFRRGGPGRGPGGDMPEGGPERRPGGGRFGTQQRPDGQL
jgi:Spy/CpxP family protein refolding chaperone